MLNAHITDNSDDFIQLKHRDLQLTLLYILDNFSQICDKHGLRYWLDAGTFLGAVRHRGFIPWDDDIDICMPRKDYETFITETHKALHNDFILQNAGNDKNIHYFFSKIRLLNSRMVTNNRKLNKTAHHSGIFIDIFPVDNVPENHFFRKLHKYSLKFLTVALRGDKLKYPDKKSLFEKVKVRLNRLLSATVQLILSDRQLLNLHRLLSSKIAENSRYFAVLGTPREYDKRIRLKEDVFPLKKYTFEGNQYWGPKAADKNLTRQYGNDYMTPPPEDKRYPPHSLGAYISASMFKKIKASRFHAPEI